MAKYLDYEGLKYLYKKIKSQEAEVSEYENVRLILSTNQNEAVNTIVKVIDEGEIIEYEYNNEPITFKIKSKNTYTIEVGDIIEDNRVIYSAPNFNQMTAEGGNSRNVEGVYKASKLTMNFNISSNSAVVDIEYDGYFKTLKNGESYLVPYNKTVIMTPISVYGYKSPKSQTISTTSQEISCAFNWTAVQVGVAIYDTSGNSYTADKWTGDKPILGIGLYTGDKIIVMAPITDYWWSSPQDGYIDIYNNSNISYPHVPNSTDYANDLLNSGVIDVGASGSHSVEAFIKHTNGKATTDIIYNLVKSKYNYNWDDSTNKLNIYGVGAPAITYAKTYSGGGRTGQWYLPSCEEWYRFINNMDEVNALCDAAYGITLTDFLESFDSSMANICTSTLYMWSNGEVCPGGPSISPYEKTSGWGGSPTSGPVGRIVIPFLEL